CYEELTRAIADPEGTVERIGELIEADPGMCAKVLQLVNSAFFGLGRRIENAREATVYLGTTTLRSLVLSVEIFNSMRPSPPIPGLSVESLAIHSARVARVSSLLATSRQDRESAFTAGLLHDTGKLLLATCRADEMTKLVATAVAESRPLYEVETDA